ncbi:MAG: hypothetical protein ACTHKZ_04795, partial [Lysobacteraceae bacterium]
ALIASARRYDAGHPDLPDSEARLAAAREHARRQAESDLRRGRLVQAADRWRTLLQFDPGDAGARRGLDRVAAAWARRATQAAADFRFAEAEAALAQAKTLAPGDAVVADAGRRIVRARQAQARLGTPASPAERARRVRRLLVEAAAAEARGDLLAPPGDSAFDKLRAARALAPRDPAVAAASARLLPVARECFERELRGNNLVRAQACLDAWATLEGAGAVRAPRQRLARRWIAVGEERLGAGELDAAQRALLAARGLDPEAPGLAAFAERVRVASAGR